MLTETEKKRHKWLEDMMRAAYIPYMFMRDDPVKRKLICAKNKTAKSWFMEWMKLEKKDAKR